MPSKLYFKNRPDQQSPDEGRGTPRPRCCNDNNKDEEKCPRVNVIMYHIFSCHDLF